jgi:carbamoyl-phosphate synthase large subunit
MRLDPDLRDYEVIGTHFDPLELAKSDIEKRFLVPKAADRAAYLEAHLKLIRRFDVGILIANSDKEVAAFASIADELPCRHLLPDETLTEAVQDKLRFHRILKNHGCATVPNVALEDHTGLGEAVKALGPREKFWIRLRSGAGSVGATWLNNAEQAEKWVELWCTLRGFERKDFILAEFLPGRDFNVSTLYQNGEHVVGKVYERLSYWHSDVSMSGMGSTPNSSVTVADIEPIRRANHAVEAVCAEFRMRPHGYFNVDLKCNAQGDPFVTEINIGRFPMTSPQHDRVGRHNLLKLYLQLVQNSNSELPRGVFDVDPGIYILRGPDMPVTFVTAAAMDALKQATP